MTPPHALRHLVVIGSSAGGIDALSVLVATLPANFPAPIVVAQHLDPARQSHLATILGKRSALRVQEVTDGAPVPLKEGIIYVAPANRNVEITDSDVVLRAHDATRSKPSVDLLLSSAAEIYGDRLIAVILTGMGSDGADGAREVKNRVAQSLSKIPRRRPTPRCRSRSPRRRSTSSLIWKALAASCMI